MTGFLGGAGSFDSGPSALIFADSEAGGLAAEASVRIVGGRIAGRLHLADAVDRLNRQASIDAVIVDLTDDHGSVADRLLDMLSYIAERDNRPVIVAARFALLDCVAARLHSGPITLLCDPDLIDRVSALALAWQNEVRLGVADITSEDDNDRLRRLAEEVSRIAQTLAKLSSTASPESGDGLKPARRVEDMRPTFAAEPVQLAPALARAEDLRAILRQRRLRNRFFDPALFADPAWDMLLDLMAARLEGESVSVTSLCIASAVPSTTALRWIRTLIDTGLVQRRADPADGRRIHISLTDPAALAMSAYLAAALGQEGLIV
ncbi:winged helix DNA-binding protein [Aquisediminimonas profunda]|uniref:winged helix DNA-binding protein n=1 Tax=Aquisediminimonas profunda TaxID=1550733 RepID=UPI001C6302FD|nr:winged helix DNA-binding protein [Aquisediminimonas profunda]